MPAMFGTFVKHRFQNTYDAILATPVDVEELVTAEMLWIGLRSSVYGCFPLFAAMAFGLDPKPGWCWCRSSASSPHSRSPGSDHDGRRSPEDRPVQLRDLLP